MIIVVIFVFLLFFLGFPSQVTPKLQDLILVQGWAKAGGEHGRTLAAFRGMLKFAPKVTPAEHKVPVQPLIKIAMGGSWW